MKRSEFRKAVEERIRRSPVFTNWSETASCAAADEAEEAGVSWDPEEPELPARLCIGSVLVDGHIEQPCLQIEGAALRHTVYSPVLREAAACYNTIHGLLRQYDERSEPEWVMWLEDFIDAERERLKT